jgi:hypothetical protein
MITRSSPTFVGRAEELRVLEAARRRAADGEPAVVLVGGEAGVGKTRLIAECASRCAADGMGVLVGGCVPVGDGALPYAPIVEALRTLVAEVGVGAVRELVGPAWPELARLLPALVSRIAAAHRARPPRLGCSSSCSDCWDAWAIRPRSSWWWRTCSGLTGPPATCSPSWSGTCAGSGFWWWSPIATTSRATRAWGPTWPSWIAPTGSGASSWPGWTGPKRRRSW